MDESIEDFIKRIRSEKLTQLAGVVFDKGYWQKIIGKDDEETLRDELSEENKKRTLDKNGKVLADHRDMERVEKLNNRIDEITNAKKELNRLEGMEHALGLYLDHIDSYGEETAKALKAVANR